MEKYEESLEKALKELKIADHIIYITYNLIRDKRLLLKALDQESLALTYLINAILQYEYLWKRIQLYSDSRNNFDTFINKCSKRYNITQEEIEEVKNILSISQLHKKSPMEFQRREKIIMMTEDLSTASIDHEKLKSYLELIKRIIKKALFVWKTSKSSF